jgi:hypothetical protein
MTHDQEHPTKSTHEVTRRNAITAAASAIVMAACACHGSHEDGAKQLAAVTNGTACSFDGFGEPYNEGVGDPKQARALLALWLLFVTRRSFVSDPADPFGAINDQMVGQVTQLVKNLKYLPSNTMNTQNESVIVRALADTLNSGFTSFGIPSTLVKQAGNGYKIGYGAALLAVQELFGFLGTGALIKGAITSVYSGDPTHCPKTEKTVLSVAAEQ